MKNENEIENDIRSFLEYIGENPDREGLKQTPSRVILSWERLFGGYKQNPVDILKTTFMEVQGYDEMILLKDIEFFSTCEHHLLPFFGKVHVAYIPLKRVVGISKLARLVEVFSRRLQIQERLTQQISNSIWECLKPKGVGVILEAKHLCMICRGVEKQNSVMITSSLKGSFKKEVSCREEFLRLCKQ